VLVPALLSLLSATPEAARFVLVVADAPVASIEVRLDGQHYLYRTRHFLEEDDAPRDVEVELGSLPAPPEVLALWKTPPAGCRDVWEETRGRTERLCVDDGGGASVKGTVDGAPFTAAYVKGLLTEIKVGSARWVRETSSGPASAALNPFVNGVAAPEKRCCALEPAVEGARWLSKPPRGIAADEGVARVRCLPLARQALGPGRRLAIGLVIEDGRAFPHAWVVEGKSDLDPSVLPGDAVLARRRYVEFPPQRAGRLLLELFDGALQVVPQR